MKMDYQLPDNATFVGAEVVPGIGIGISGTPANVLRINEAANPTRPARSCACPATTR